MDSMLYSKLSALMFFEFAVWGAWMPVLAARLLGPLKMSARQTGWVYGMLFLANIITPLIAGQIVDRWLPTEWFLCGAHLAGGAIMWLSARQTRFVPMLVTIGLYSLLFAPTIPLANGLMFTHLKNPQEHAFWVILWGPIGWTASGWVLTAWRRWSKAANDGRDCQILAAILSVVMAGCCLLQPHTPPAGAGENVWPFLDALKLLENTDFLLFIVISFAVTSLMQFYFLGTAPFLEVVGVSQKNVPAVMSIAQIGQIVAMPLVPIVLSALGYKWTLSLGALLWLGMYLVYSAMKPRALVVGSMALHGLAYAFFVNVGWLYVSVVAPEGIQNSAQALLVVATFGLGMFVGTQMAGLVMDKCRAGSQFRWRAIFLVPCVVLLICLAALVAAFEGVPG